MPGPGRRRPMPRKVAMRLAQMRGARPGRPFGKLRAGPRYSRGDAGAMVRRIRLHDSSSGSSGLLSRMAFLGVGYGGGDYVLRRWPICRDR